MNSPLETNAFRFFLNFKNDDSFGKIEITEPIGFDVLTSTLEQDIYGRDVLYGAEDIKLQFQDVYSTQHIPTITLPNGVIIDRLSMGLVFLLEYHKLYGYESEVEFSITKNGNEFILGLLDFSESETDGLTYFNCVIITKTDKAILRRRIDTKVDVYSSEDLDGNYSEPVETHSILLKAKPVRQISKWTEDKPNGLYATFLSNTNIQARGIIPIARNLQLFGIENSYTSFYEWVISPADENPLGAYFDTKIITAETSLSNIKIELKNVTIQGTYNTFISGSYPPILFLIRFVNNDTLETKQINLGTQNGVIDISNQDYSFDLDIINAGESINIMLWLPLVIPSLTTSPVISINKFTVDSLTVETTSTAVDSVIKGVRHIDFIKNVAKKSANYDVIAPRYDIGGKFYDNFVFNGYGIRQFIQTESDGTSVVNIKPFTTSWKEVVEQLPELNSDYQVLEDKKLFIGNYEDFYANKDLGSFLQIPDEDFEIEFNENYKAQNFNYGYKTFEQSKDEDNTIDAVHTKSEWFLPNRQIEGIKSIDVPYIRDPYKIESTRKENFASSNSKSLSEDNSIFILDCVPLPPNSTNTMSNVLDVLITNTPDSEMKIIARDNFRWDLLGFEGGDLFINVSFRLNGVNYGYGGTLKVKEIQPTLLTLENIGFPFDNAILGNHNLFITIEYPLSNVNYVNRTDEDFQVIENVIEPNDFSNLQYTIRRNMKYWESFINTLCNYSQNGIIRNTFFQPNGELITEFENGGLIKENENIPVSELSQRVITPVVYKTRVFCSFDKAIELFKAMETLNDNDTTIAGFTRIYNQENKLLKVYPKKLTYFWGTEILEIEGEDKYESDYIAINKVSEEGIISINETGYETDLVKPLVYKANGNYVQLFDKRSVPLTNATHFSKFKVNNEEFEDVVSLTKAIDGIY